MTVAWQPPVVHHQPCLACGSVFRVARSTGRDGPEMFTDIEVGHVGRMDAACRWVAETLADELAAVQRQALARFATDMTEPDPPAGWPPVG